MCRPRSLGMATWKREQGLPCDGPAKLSRVTIQDVGIVASLLIGGGGLVLGVLNYRRDAERLSIDRERRADERKAKLPQLRIMRRSLSQQGLDHIGQPKFSIDAQLDPGPDATEVWLEATFGTEEPRLSAQSFLMRSGSGQRFEVTVPPTWTINNLQALKPGVVLRLYDDHAQVEDRLPVE
jgi:hypothetical protein